MLWVRNWNFETLVIISVNQREHSVDGSAWWSVTWFDVKYVKCALRKHYKSLLPVGRYMPLPPRITGHLRAPNVYELTTIPKIAHVGYQHNPVDVQGE